MNNQHAGLSQVLAEQRRTERHEEAAHARLVRGARPSRLRGRSRAARGWWRLARWPGVATDSPSAALKPAVDRSEATMSKLARTLVLGATLAAMNLAGMTTVAHAQPTAEPTSKQHARRPPTQRQVGEAWRQLQVAAEEPTVAGDTRWPPTESQVGESWRHRVNVPVRPAEPGGQPSWLVASLGVLTAALALSGGLVVLATKRAGRRVRARQAA
jgi:hypothetical protein